MSIQLSARALRIGQRYKNSQCGFRSLKFRIPVSGFFVSGCSVCGSMFNMVARAHTYTVQCNAAAAVQQPEGWRIVDPLQCLGGSTHWWVPVDTTVHQCPKGMAVGGPCDQTAQQYSAETPQTCRFSSVNTPTPTTQTQACQGSALRWHPEFPPQRRQHCISTGLLGEGSGSGVHESSGDLLGQQLGRRLGRKHLLARRLGKSLG